MTVGPTKAAVEDAQREMMRELVEARQEIERLRQVAEWCKRRLGSAYWPHVDKMIAGEVPPVGLAKFVD